MLTRSMDPLQRVLDRAHERALGIIRQPNKSKAARPNRKARPRAWMYTDNAARILKETCERLKQRHDREIAEIRAQQGRCRAAAAESKPRDVARSSRRGAVYL